MPSSAVIRVQQQQQGLIVNPNSHRNLNSEQHTISMFRLFLRGFDYIYLLSAKIFFYFLLMFKRLLRFFIGVWTFIFVTLRGSKKKVLNKILNICISKNVMYVYFSLFNFNLLNIIIVLFNHYHFIDYVCFIIYFQL